MCSCDKVTASEGKSTVSHDKSILLDKSCISGDELGQGGGGTYVAALPLCLRLYLVAIDYEH